MADNSEVSSETQPMDYVPIIGTHFLFPIADLFDVVSKMASGPNEVQARVGRSHVPQVGRSEDEADAPPSPQRISHSCLLQRCVVLQTAARFLQVLEAKGIFRASGFPMKIGNSYLSFFDWAQRA